MKWLKIQICFAITIILISCGDKKQVKSIKSPIRVKTEVVTTKNYSSDCTYVGIVEENGSTAISFTSMGVIRKMNVDEGQYVRQGQLLAEMDNVTSENTLEVTQVSTTQANDMVEQAQATYDQAKDAYDRMKVMYEAGALPEIKWIEAETSLRRAETALKTAQSGVTSAQATERIAKKNVEDNLLYAPVSGVIGKKILTVGETALPSQAVVNIINIDNVKVKVSVPEMELRNISSNTHSSIRVAAANVYVEGGRIEKGVMADALTHTYDVRINVKNPGHTLLPGMVADVTFGNYSGSASLMLPITAVQKKGDSSYFVWTVSDDNKAHRTSVSIGDTFGNYVAITGGIEEGQRIVVEGYQKLSEGTKVVF